MSERFPHRACCLIAPARSGTSCSDELVGIMIRVSSLAIQPTARDQFSCSCEKPSLLLVGGRRFYRGLFRAGGFIQLCDENPFLIPVELLSYPPSRGST